MKKLFLILLTGFLNIALFSCTNDSIAEDESLIPVQATEGEDGEVNEDPDDPDDPQGP